jgi:hypothetical protein
MIRQTFMFDQIRLRPKDRIADGESAAEDAAQAKDANAHQ